MTFLNLTRTFPVNNKNLFPMTKFYILPVLLLSLSFLPLRSFSQFKHPFGKVTLDELSDKPYKPDPGADALVLSETCLASVAFQESFYIDVEINRKIKIVNKGGFPYASIKIVYRTDDKLENIKASTFNLRDGEKIETQVLKESFITEHTSSRYNTLKFNFTDIHEGSVVEFSYKMRLNDDWLFGLVPWQFQGSIPTAQSTLTVVFPEAFSYKAIIGGNSASVTTDFAKAPTNFFGQGIDANVWTYTASNVPAFREEPFIVSRKQHLTKVTFELARVDFPRITYENISPTYEKLNQKLLDREDFGTAISTNLKSATDDVIAGTTDELSKLKKIHKYVSEKVTWDGENDFEASVGLRNSLRKEKGNSADVNMILIAMLRSAGLKADPVILSTRPNGSLSLFSALLQQFDYVLASVQAGGKTYLVDATDPLRPFDMLPFDCLNGSGRLISLTESAFVDLKNNESKSSSRNFDLLLSADGTMAGKMEFSESGIEAYNSRHLALLEGEDGFRDWFLINNPNMEISGLTIAGLKDAYSNLNVSGQVKVKSCASVVSDRIILNLSGLSALNKNPFFEQERKYPVDFGCPSSEKLSIRIRIPQGYKVDMKPADLTVEPGDKAGKYEYTCKVEGDEIVLNSSSAIDKTIFELPEYPKLREYYQKILGKENEIIILKKNPVSK
jgi:hypothetical protein